MNMLADSMSAAVEQARDEYLTALSKHGRTLVNALSAAGARLDPHVDPATLLAVARRECRAGTYFSPALARFEHSVRPSLHVYAALASRFAGYPLVWPEAAAVLRHFAEHTDDPIAPNWFERVVLCAQYTYRAWRRIRRVNRDRSPSDGFPR